MKKIQTKQEQEKKEKRNRLLISIILIGVMLFGTAGYAFFGREAERKTDRVSYNGYEFSLAESGLWLTEIQGYTFGFSYLPNETEEVAVPVTLTINSYANKPLYISSENPTATREVTQNLAQFLSRIPQEVCVDENCTQDWPIKNCSDNLIIIKESEIKGIEQEDNCAYIKGNYSELIKISDAFLYKILGIRKF